MYYYNIIVIKGGIFQETLYLGSTWTHFTVGELKHLELRHACMHVQSFYSNQLEITCAICITWYVFPVHQSPLKMLCV